MEAHIHEWVNLLTRWIHMIVGVAWIGASFYFNWLENNLDRRAPQDDGIAGNLWAIHGGGFYHLKKYTTGPDSLPAPLHWFKWEAYTTWLSGISLLVIVYYFNARAYVIDPAVRDLAPWQGISVGLLSLLLSWLVYDLLCRSALRGKPKVLAITVFLWFSLLAWLLSELISGRAAYIHIGAAIGTVMVANVFFVIIPAQKEMVSALVEQRPLDPKHGQSGLLRSRHNNYLTLPVLFTMISSHFPSTYGSTSGWLILAGLSLIGVAVRHYFNIRHESKWLHWILPLAFIAMVGLMWLTTPNTLTQQTDPSKISDQNLLTVVHQRCSTCHAQNPTQPGFSVAPKNIILETVAHMKQHQDLIIQTTTVSKIMPLGNLTGMTDEERQLLALWYQQR